MRVVVDTNVAVVASERHPGVSDACVLGCIERLRQISEGEDALVIDDGWHILREYMANLRQSGQPGVGDRFLKWVLDNLKNPSRCEQVAITPVDGAYERGFREFPQDPCLVGFDRSDRKFVAVSLVHRQRPPILNATDSDWWDYREALERNGVRVVFLCRELFARTA